ncbi:MAG: hypothetical protein JNG84_11115 [Archangium sp.]|nr:hypothetical protein [Archangium sp.]
MSWLALMLLGDVSTVQLTETSCGALLSARVGAELRAAGFVIAERDAALARIHLECEGAKLTIHIDDQLTDKRVSRQTIAPVDARARAQAATHVLELLHASLAEARFRHAPVPPAVDTFLGPEPDQRPRLWRATLLGGVLVAPGRIGVLPAAWVEVGRRLGPLELSARLGVGLQTARFTGDEGTTDVGLALATVQVAWPFQLDALHVQPRLGLSGLGLWAAAVANLGFDGKAVVATTPAATVGVDVERALLPWLALRVSADVSLAPVPLQVRFPVSSPASAGLPLLSLAIGASVR